MLNKELGRVRLSRGQDAQEEPESEKELKKLEERERLAARTAD